MIIVFWKYELLELFPRKRIKVLIWNKEDKLKMFLIYKITEIIFNLKTKLFVIYFPPYKIASVDQLLIIQ